MQMEILSEKSGPSYVGKMRNEVLWFFGNKNHNLIKINGLAPYTKGIKNDGTETTLF